MGVFLLLLIGVLLVVLNVNAMRKEKTSFSAALSNKEKNVQDYEVEIGKLRKEFAETILELQKEIEVLKTGTYITDKENNINESSYIYKEDKKKKSIDIKDGEVIHIKKNGEEINAGDESTVYSEAYGKSGKKIDKTKKEIVKNSDNNINNENKKDENSKESYNNVKVDEISKMLKSGLSIDEISEKVGMGKGEVILIKELYTK